MNTVGVCKKKKNENALIALDMGGYTDTNGVILLVSFCCQTKGKSAYRLFDIKSKLRKDESISNAISSALVFLESSLPCKPLFFPCYFK